MTPHFYENHYIFIEMQYFWDPQVITSGLKSQFSANPRKIWGKVFLLNFDIFKTLRLTSLVHINVFLLYGTQDSPMFQPNGKYSGQQRPLGVGWGDGRNNTGDKKRIF